MAAAAACPLPPAEQALPPDAAVRRPPSAGASFLPSLPLDPDIEAALSAVTANSTAAWLNTSRRLARRAAPSGGDCGISETANPRSLVRSPGVFASLSHRTAAAVRPGFSSNKLEGRVPVSAASPHVLSRCQRACGACWTRAPQRREGRACCYLPLPGLPPPPAATPTHLPSRPSAGRMPTWG